jgi:hypothetical protein
MIKGLAQAAARLPQEIDRIVDRSLHPDRNAAILSGPGQWC